MIIDHIIRISKTTCENTFAGVVNLKSITVHSDQSHQVSGIDIDKSELTTNQKCRLHFL